MQKQTLIFAVLLAVLAIAAGAFLFFQMGDAPLAPVRTWSEAEEVDGAEPEDAEQATAENALERSEATPTAAAAAANAALDSEPRVDAILRGRVLDKFQRPVAGAKVWLEIGRSRQNGGRTGRNRRGQTRRIPEPVETNAEGLFAFQGQAFRQLRVSLQVRHESHAVGLFQKDLGDIRTATAETVVSTASGAEIALGDLVLKSGGLVRGRVTDLAGNGIMGAEVELRPDWRNQLRRQRNRSELLPNVQSDANGYYRFPNAPEGRYTISVLATMHLPGSSDDFETAEDAVVDVPDIQLGPGFEVTGIVRDEQGEPVAKATVSMRKSLQGNGADEGDGQGQGRGRGRGARGFFGGNRNQRAETDEEGRFTIEHLPGAIMEVEVSAKGFLDYKEDGIDTRLPRPVLLTISQGLRITGVVQTPDGLPVTSFAIQAVRLRGLPDPNEEAIDWNDVMQKMRDPNLSAEDRRKLERQMRSAGDSFRRGRRGGRGGNRGQRAQLGNAEPHPGGRFTIDELQEGIYQVRVEAPDYARLLSQEVTVSLNAAPPELMLTLDAGVYVAGVVQDNYGDAVANAEVELRTATVNKEPASNQGGGRNGFDFNRMAARFRRGASPDQLELTVRTDDDGNFIFKNVPTGEYDLRASGDGYSEERGDAFALSNNRSDFTLTLEPLGSIVGKVTGITAAEMGEVRVGAVLAPEDGFNMMSMFGRGGRDAMKTGNVEADGSYRLEGLKAGNYIVRSWIGSPRELIRKLGPDMMAGNLVSDVSVRSGNEVTWNMQLTRPMVGVVKGLVLLNGQNGKGLRVELRRNDNGDAGGGGRDNNPMARMFNRSPSGTVSGGGTFEIKNVQAGGYQLQIKSGGRRGNVIYEESIQVVADVTIEQTWSVQSGSLKGTITVPDGSDPADIGGRVSLVRDQTAVPTEDLRDWLRAQNAIGARIRDGAFEVEAMPMGNYLVVLQARNRTVTSQQVYVNGEQTVSVVAGEVTEASAETGAPRPGNARQGNRGGGGARGQGGRGQGGRGGGGQGGRGQGGRGRGNGGR
ncbi:MAG: carboxypeptidase regulatory-like domain-containing protein [Planctomycetota bacterium]